jgi:Ricin-type beta-trefoil lectin domain-like
MRNLWRLSRVLLAAVIAMTISLLNVGPAGATARTSSDVTAATSGFDEVVNSNSAYCMTILGNATANGSKVAQAQCKADPGQKWVLIAYPDTYDLWNLYNPNSGKCLDTSWNRDRAQLYIWACSGLPSSNTNQLFASLASGSYITIRPNWNVSKCVGVAGGSLVTHTPIVFADCNNSYGQKWYFWAV